VLRSRSLSGVAVCADIATKTMDASEDKRWATLGYHTAFHVPASLVIPAVIIHKIVHVSQNAVQSSAALRNVSSRTKSFVPVGAALLSIGPVVPIVDHVCEMVMEPTLGAMLGLEFSHHESGHHSDEDKHTKDE